MTNAFYNPTGAPGAKSSGSSAALRAEFNLIAAAFDKFPLYAGNGGKLVRVKATEDGFDIASSVDSTPIGQGTAAPGSFTTLSASGPAIAGRASSLWGITSHVGDTGNSLTDMVVVGGVTTLSAFSAAFPAQLAF